MLLTNEQSNIIYDMLYNWLAVHTPGERRNLSTLKSYQEKVWSPIINIINEISSKEDLKEEEQDFLHSVIYKGEIYRIQRYNPRKRGYLFENPNFQSWSRNIEGVSNVTNILGTVLLIIGTASNGIDVFGLLYFLLNNKYITCINEFKHPRNLLRYEKEQEIAYPINLSCINDIVAIEKDKLSEWKNDGIIIPKDKWKSNSFH